MFRKARKTVSRGRAVVHKMHPFTIRLKDRTVQQSQLQPLRLKLDPGAKTTGVAVLREDGDVAETVFLCEIHHKTDIKQKLDARCAVRRSRRNRKTRYRKPRFLNRRRPEGWLPPSFKARADQLINAVRKLTKLLPISAISIEDAKFDTQKLQNPEISGIEYQRGTLFGYEVREYLLEKWGRKCAYCGRSDVPLEIDHIVPRSRGGTDRVSNLTLACRECNQKKGNKTAAEFGYPHVEEQARQTYKQPAFMNSIRSYLRKSLSSFGIPAEYGTGALTKANRIRLGLPKKHYFDACCVGESTSSEIRITQSYVQIWHAVGRGTRQMCNTDKFGFPRGHRQRRKKHFGFQTGDIVKAIVPRGKYAGTWVGAVAVRGSGFFDIKDTNGKRICQGISYKYCKLIQIADGWQYSKRKANYSKSHTTEVACL
ncbi:RNA-guided endonuclease IscB [Fervidobacterium islandicum]|uniref:RNA-guided endonuclease IscB n=1 Tax=Fervidobacterium islandicum TaxID=2423 RepID=UPI003A65975B